MSNAYRANRKASDADIIRLNSVGLSLATIARALDCHPTTITLRLRSLNIAPADTRRSFMEDVFLSLDLPTQEWLADELSSGMSVKEYVRELIVQEHQRHLKPKEKQSNEHSLQHSRMVSESGTPTDGQESSSTNGSTS